MDIKLPTTLPKVKLNPSLSKAKVGWGEVALLVIIIGVVFWFLILPKNSEVKSEHQQLEALSARTVEIQGQAAVLKNLVDSLSASGKDVEKLDEGLPLTGRTTRLQMLLEGIASSSGMNNTKISVDNPSSGVVAGDVALLENEFKAGRSLQVVSAFVDVTSTMDKLVVFLQKLERSGRIFAVKTLEIGPAEDQQLNMKLTLDAYYFGQPQTKAGTGVSHTDTRSAAN